MNKSSMIRIRRKTIIRRIQQRRRRLNQFMRLASKNTNGLKIKHFGKLSVTRFKDSTRIVIMVSNGSSVKTLRIPHHKLKKRRNILITLF